MRVQIEGNVDTEVLVDVNANDEWKRPEDELKFRLEVK